MVPKGTFYNDSQTRDICQSFFKLQQSSDSSCDVSLFIENGQEVRVHGSIFAASSGVLRDLLTNRREPEFAKTLNVTGISSEALESLIKYLYTGELCITVEFVGEILRKCIEWKLSFAEEKCYCFIRSHYAHSSADLDFGFHSSKCSAERVGNISKNLLQLRNDNALLPSNDYSRIPFLHNKSFKVKALSEVELWSKKSYEGKKFDQDSSGISEPSRINQNIDSACNLKDQPADCSNADPDQSRSKNMSQERNSCKYLYSLGNLTDKTCKKPKQLHDAAVEETVFSTSSPCTEFNAMMDDESRSLLQKSSDKVVSQNSLHVSTEISTGTEHETFRTEHSQSPNLSVVDSFDKNAGLEPKHLTVHLSDKVLTGNLSNMDDDFMYHAECLIDVKRKTKNKYKYQEKVNVSEDNRLKPECKLEEEACRDTRQRMDNFEEPTNFNETRRESQFTGAETPKNDQDISTTNFSMSNADMKSAKVQYFSCPKCHRNFNTAARLVQHLNRCEKTKMRKRSIHRRLFKCTECNFCSSRSQSYLDEHMFKKHNKPVESDLKFLVCTVSGCDYQTLQPKLLSLHMNRHRTEKPFMCEECGARLKSEGILIRHMKLHKNGNKKPFNCGDCGTSLGSKMSLKLHVRRLHQKQLNFLCANCPYRAFSKDALEGHQFSLHGICPPSREIHRCQHCDWKTLVKSHLRRHLRRHVGEKTHECSTCHSRFVDLTELRSHERRHFNGSRRVHCTFAGCSHSEFNKHKLSEHIRMAHTHKGEKPWKCEMCDHCTALKGNLTKHLRTVHKVEVLTKQKRLAKVDSHDISNDRGLAEDGGNGKSTLNLLTVRTPESNLISHTQILSSNNTDTTIMHASLSPRHPIMPHYAMRTLTSGQLSNSFVSLAGNLSQPQTAHGVSALHMTPHFV